MKAFQQNSYVGIYMKILDVPLFNIFLSVGSIMARLSRFQGHFNDIAHELG